MKTNQTILRTCIFSKKKLQQSEMIRIVKTKNIKFFVNSLEKGRGAYISKNIPQPELILRKKLLNRVFRCEVPIETYKELIELIKGDENEKR